MANVKHYVLNNQGTDRGSIDEIIGGWPVHEIYVSAFKVAAREAHVNELYKCENAPLLNGVLRNLIPTVLKLHHTAIGLAMPGDRRLEHVSITNTHSSLNTKFYLGVSSL